MKHRLAQAAGILTVALGTACESPPEPVDHTLHVSLVMVLTRPGDIPTPQRIAVHGFLGGGTFTQLFLTSEHAAANDSLSSISVSPPSEEFVSGPCTEQFVEVFGTLVRSSGGEFFIRDLEKVTIRMRRQPGNPPSWRTIVPEQCWP